MFFKSLCANVLIIFFISIVYSFSQSPDFRIDYLSTSSSIGAGRTYTAGVLARNYGQRGNQNGSYVIIRLYLSQDNVFNTNDTYTDVRVPIAEWNNQASVSRTISLTAPCNTSGYYYWGVEVDPADYWNESNENNNSRSATTNIYYPPPDIISPLSNQTIHNILLRWDRFNYVEGYQLFIDRNIVNVGNTFSYKPNGLNFGWHEWKIRTINSNNCYSNWSSIQRFNYTGFLPPDQLYPINNQEIYNLELRWSSVEDSYGYEIYLDDGLTVLIKNSSQTTYQPTLNRGWHKWKIRTKNNDGKYGLWSDFENFLYTPRPVLNTPVQNNTNGYTSFSWSDVGVNKYELWIDNDSSIDQNTGDFKSPEVSPRNRNYDKITSTSQQVPSNRLEPYKTYYAYVRAIFPYNQRSEKSNIVSFYYNPKAASSPNWVPLYRAYNNSEVDHFYCSNMTHLNIAKDQGFNFEGIEGYISDKVFKTGSNGLKCIYRFYGNPDLNTNTKKHHYYVFSSDSRDDLISRGYEYEGIVGYTYENIQNRDGMIKLFHTLKNQNNIIDNFYTTSYAEYKNSINRFGYTDQGTACYVSRDGSNKNNNPLNYKFLLGLINLFSGGVSHSESCFSIPMGLMNLSFGFQYSSVSCMFPDDLIPIGYGWSHSYSAYLKINNNDITAHWPGGTYHEYPIPTSSSEYSSRTKGVYNKLIKISNNEYIIKTKDQTKIKFVKRHSSDIIYLLKMITDRKGNTLTCYYDNKYRLTEVAVPNNTSTYHKSLSFTYYPNNTNSIHDRSKLIKKITDNSLSPAREISFEYDDDMNLTSYTDVMGNTTNYSYDADFKQAHLLAEVALPDNKKITNSFDKNQNDISKSTISSQEIGSGNNKSKVEFVPSNDFKIVDVKTYQNGVLDQTFKIYSNSNTLGLIDKIVHNGNEYTEYEYGSSANPTLPTKIIDGRHNETSIEYDNRGNTKKITQPLNTVHKFNYNIYNDLTNYYNPRNILTEYQYATNGNLEKIITPCGNNSRCTTYVYYNTSGLKNGTVSSYIDAMSRRTSYDYDNYGNIKKITGPQSIAVTTFDSYDGANRLLQITVKNAQNGSQKNQVTKYEYYKNDLIKKVVRIGKNNSEISTSYEYDDNYNLKKITDAKSHYTRMFYQSERNLLDYTLNQVNEKTKFSYYDNGLIKQITKPNSQSINYQYDGNGNLTNLSIPNYSASMTYDKNFNLKSVRDNNRTITFSNYDKLDRLTSYTDYWGHTISYTYDKNSNIKTIKYPGNKTVTYLYYDDDLLKSVTDWNNRTTQYFYNNDGSIDYIRNGNSTVTRYSYDNAGRPTGLSNKKSNNDIINSYTYTLDKLGNHTRVAINEPISMFPINSSTSGYSYNAANRITTSGFDFDKNGNMTEKRVDNQTINFSYDVLNRLKEIRGNSNFDFQYDYFGNRRKVTKDNNIKKYVYDFNSPLNNLLMETDNNGNVINYYIYGIGLISRIKPDNSTHYYHYDSRGSTIAMTDVNQNITHKYSYDDFGKISQAVEPENDFNPFRFVGQYGVIDDDNGFIYMRARYYDPEIGRFLSEDPVWSVNLYPYADNNPIMGIDPKGQWTLQGHGGITESAIVGLGFSDLQVKDLILGNKSSDQGRLAAHHTGIPQNMNRHALRNLGQSREEAKAEWWNIIQTDLTSYIESGDLFSLGRAIHSVQDAFNPGHDFTLGGYTQGLGHKAFDELGSSSIYYQMAVRATRYILIEAQQKRNEHLQRSSSAW